VHRKWSSTKNSGEYTESGDESRNAMFRAFLRYIPMMRPCSTKGFLAVIPKTTIGAIDTLIRTLPIRHRLGLWDPPSFRALSNLPEPLPRRRPLLFGGSTLARKSQYLHPFPSGWRAPPPRKPCRGPKRRRPSTSDSLRNSSGSSALAIHLSGCSGSSSRETS